MRIRAEKIPVYGAILIIAVITVLLIIEMPAIGYSANVSPSIYTSMSPEPGVNVTVSGQNFTPGGIAVLYSIEFNNYTTNADQNGNAAWTYTNYGLAPYPIYAVDMATNRSSNTVTVFPVLNDATPSPTQSSTPVPTPAPAPAPFPGIAGICAIGLGIIAYALRKK